MDNNVQPANGGLLDNNQTSSVGDSAVAGDTGDVGLEQVSEPAEVVPPLMSQNNVVEESVLGSNDTLSEKDDEKSVNDIDTFTTTIEDREEDSESYMDDTVDY